MVGPMENPMTAYCPSCNVRLGGDATYAVAVGNAQVHASICGHPVQLVDATTWEAVETVSGEPSLPLWESESS